MSKELKHFIDEHRREFDEEPPSSSAWQQVERSISATKKVRLVSVRDLYKWTAAAAVFFIMAAGFFLLVVRKNKDDAVIVKTGTTPGNQTEKTTDLSTIAPEYAGEARLIYQAIESQQQQLKAIAKEQPGLYSQFAEDLAALDSSYRVLKTQAVQTPSREVIIRAMLQNLQLQAELLGKQLRILQEFKNNKTEKDEKNNHPGI